MNFNSYTIVITGLGGQGLIRLLQILGTALMEKGYKVITSETHGLSQRGGNVTCFLLFGNKLNAPLPMIGSADMIIALEESTILNALKYAKSDKSTRLVISTFEKPIMGEKYPSIESLLNVLYKISDNIYFIPASEIAVIHAGNAKFMNIVILGYILRFLPLTEMDLETSIKQQFIDRVLELNLGVFKEGVKL